MKNLGHQAKVFKVAGEVAASPNIPSGLVAGTAWSNFLTLAGQTRHWKMPGP